MRTPVTAGIRFHTILFILFCLAALELYEPARRGPFVFDDSILPFNLTRFETEPLSAWMSGTRPILMLSYWVNFVLSGRDPAPFHSLNVLIHSVNALLVFLIGRRLFRMSGITSPVAPALLASLFLVHPLQTESVSYIAGRSESLSAMFSLGAYLCFLMRGEAAITWGRAVAVCVLYGAAVGTKEHAVVLVAVFLLTDYFFHYPFTLQGIRLNWRLYAPLGVLGAAGVAAAYRVLATSQSAGFSLRGITWDQYLMTETRAFFSYLLLAIAPVGQSLDHHYPVSRNIFEYGAIYSATALVLLVGLAIALRKRFPLASFGFLLTLILLAPTSSIVPIADPFAERRMYLPLVGLLLMGLSVAAIEPARKYAWYTAAAVLLPLAVLTYQRNVLWGNPLLMWTSAVQHHPEKSRPYTHLAESAILEGACDEAAPLILSALERKPRDYHLLIAAGKILECRNNPREALAVLKKASEIRPCSEAFELLGLLYGEMRDMELSKVALERAIELDPKSFSAHMAMALWYEAGRDIPNALASYRRVLQLEPNHAPAHAAIRSLEASTVMRSVQLRSTRNSSSY